MNNFKRIMDEEFKISVIGDIIIGSSSVLYFCIAVIIASLFFTYSTNKTTSMYPTIEEGSNIIGARYYTDIKRGDILSIDKIDEEHIWIKRVLGLPGETIEFKDGNVYIDGEKHIDTHTYAGESAEFLKIKLSSDEYFVVGDNRYMSKDSRSIGPIKKDQIISKVVYIFNAGKSLGFGKSEMDGDGTGLKYMAPSDLY